MTDTTNPTDTRIGWMVEPDGSRVYYTVTSGAHGAYVYGTLEDIEALLRASPHPR